MFDMTNLAVITMKELRDALRNRWFVVFTLAFTGIALVLSAVLQPSGLSLRTASYSRTAASLINLVLLFVPLIGLTLGATNLTSDRETGALAYLLAQPVNRVEVLLGKYLGLAGALLATLTLGFGVAGVALALQGSVQDAGSYLFTVLLAYLLALAMLSLGFLLAVFAQKTTAALGGALFLWLLLVFIGDLGLMGSAIAMQLPIQTVFFITLLNPLQLFKIASILSIQAHLDVLGPAGLYANEVLGQALLPLLLVGLIVWIIVPLGAALWLFIRQEKFTFKGATS